MQSLEREPLLQSGRRTYGEFSGLGHLSTLADLDSVSSTSSAVYEDDDIRVSVGECLLMVTEQGHDKYSLLIGQEFVDPSCTHLNDQTAVINDRVKNCHCHMAASRM